MPVATQITDQVSWANCKVELSVDPALLVWTDISGETSSIEQNGGDRAVSTKHTAKGDTPIITQGKRDGIEITVHTVYSEVVTRAPLVAEAAYEAGTLAAVRWSPRGGLTGQKQFTTGLGPIKSFLYPVGDAESSDAVITDFTISVPSVTAGLAA